MINVACVLRTGGIYTPEWVARLQEGVRRHMDRPHRFVCLSDLDGALLPCETIPLKTDWPGWWAKIELFRPRLFEGPVLYIDLDCIITGPIDGLPRRVQGFTMTRDFLGKGMNSSVMSWWGDYQHLPEKMNEEPGLRQKYQRTPDGRIGDQAFIEDHADPAMDAFADGQVVSFKRHARNGPPQGAKIVAFHGKPKPPEAGGWAAQAWRKEKP